MAEIQEFPKWLYNADGLGVVVHDEDEQTAKADEGFHPVGWKPEQPEKKSKAK